MNTVLEKPWAILLCRFNDDLNVPSQTTLAELYAQWKSAHGQQWLNANALPQQATDGRTILQLYSAFFTPAGAGTFNAVRYWDEMSHGTVDISGSTVFECLLDMTSDEGASLAANPGGSAYQNSMFQTAKAALKAQHGVNWQDFYGVAVSFQSPDYGSQGGWYDGGPGVYMDIRYVMGNGIQAWGQEMGHGFGLDHSRLADGDDSDYRDPWDVMSTFSAYSDVDINYGHRGPGLNAWNMRGREWLDETRVWKHGTASPFSQTIVIRPLHRRDLTGYLAMELPGDGPGNRYLLEYRIQANWDSGIPESCVLVHRFEGAIGQFLGTHSYLMLGTDNQESLVVGDSFAYGGGLGPRTQIDVMGINDLDQKATISIVYSAALNRYLLRPIPKWEWSPDKILANAGRLSTEDLERMAIQARQASQTIQTLLNEREAR